MIRIWIYVSFAVGLLHFLNTEERWRQRAQRGFAKCRSIILLRVLLFPLCLCLRSSGHLRCTPIVVQKSGLVLEAG
jgi:hypothetical protein